MTPIPDNLLKGSHILRETHPKDTQKTEVSWESVERSFIYDALMKNNWNRKATAAHLGIHPTTLWRKIKRLDIEIPKKGSRSKAE